MGSRGPRTRSMGYGPPTPDCSRGGGGSNSSPGSSPSASRSHPVYGGNATSGCTRRGSPRSALLTMGSTIAPRHGSILAWLRASDSTTHPGYALGTRQHSGLRLPPIGGGLLRRSRPIISGRTVLRRPGHSTVPTAAHLSSGGSSSSSLSYAVSGSNSPTHVP